jgi:tRNA synthetases class I (I, L, M and V)
VTSATHATNAQLRYPCTRRLQITPAHDAKDFATGKRNNLEFINILNDDGTLNERCGPYAGRPRYEVRQCANLIWTSTSGCLSLRLEGTSNFWEIPHHWAEAAGALPSRCGRRSWSFWRARACSAARAPTPWSLACAAALATLSSR